MTKDLWGYERKPEPDLVEVVRCKDCEHWKTVVDRDKAEIGLCYGFKLLFLPFTTPWNGYCYKGEKRK